jgi:hypothetical protein
LHIVNRILHFIRVVKKMCLWVRFEVMSIKLILAPKNIFTLIILILYYCACLALLFKKFVAVKKS